MTGAVAARPALPALPRPIARRRELGLIVVVAATLALGGLSLGLTTTGRFTVAAAVPLATYVAALVAVHVALVLAGRRVDEVLLPAVGLLGGIGLLLMERLPQSLVEQRVAGLDLGLGDLQLAWLVLSFALAATVAIGMRSDRWLRLYKYTWAAFGLVLLALTLVIGNDINGSRLSLELGPLSGQPSELLKVILVVFFAGYLADYRPLLADARVRLVGRITLPPPPYLIPIAAMLALALGIVVVQRDLGAALLFYAVFLGIFYVATGRLIDVVLGLALFLVGFVILAGLFPTVRERVDLWLNPWADPLGTGYQIIQALHAFARGGLVGTGLGAGLPLVDGNLPIPAVHTDFPLAAIGEELGLLGVLALIGCYLIVVTRGFRTAASAPDDFRALLATGLSLVLGVQVAIIAAGNLDLIPLTGITLPYVSYGGSSLLVNGLVLGMLLALSDRGPVPPRPPGARRWRLGPGAGR